MLICIQTKFKCFCYIEAFEEIELHIDCDSGLAQRDLHLPRFTMIIIVR